MKLKKKKKIDYRYYIYIVILAACIALAVFVYNTSCIRLWQSLVNLCTATAYYFAQILKLDVTVETKLTELISVDISKFLPYPMEEMLYKLKALFPELFKWEHFSKYTLYSLQMLQILALISPMLILLCTVIGKLTVSMYLKQTEKKGNSKPLEVYLSKIKPKLDAVIFWVADFIDFGKRKHFITVLALIWLLNLNIVSIAVSVLAFYLYFVASFNMFALLVNIVNLLADLIIMFAGLPLICWLVIGYIILDGIRRYIGFERLMHNENKNRGFINSLSLNNLITGTMRAGKNTTEADMILSYESMLRDKALELMLENAHKFPNFPFHEFEHKLDKCIEHHTVYNLATARELVKLQRERFELDPVKDKLYGYECEEFGNLWFNNGMCYEYLFDVLESYAQLYFMYSLPTSLILSSFAIRSGAKRISLGHLPMWENDFFRSPPVWEITPEDMSHVMDFDAFRLGKKVQKDNPNVGSIEFGALGITEKDKERGNSLDHQSLKKDSPEANPKNDLYNTGLKTQGHSATVDFYTFVKSWGDAQRAVDVNASEREVSMELNIVDKSDDMLAMPFFEVETLIDKILVPKFDSFYKKYRYNREDGTLLMYLMHNLVSRYHAYFIRNFNTFGYYVLDIGIVKPGQEEALEIHKYPISRKKTFAKRFATDCLRGFHHQRALSTKVGLADYETYESLHPTWDTWKRQNSYFVNDLEKYIQG